MATTTVTITGDVTDMLAGDFDYRRTKVYLKHNTDYVVDPDAGVVRLGSATLSISSDGTFALTDVIASVDTIENLQATVYVDYADPATRSRKTQSFGPYDLSGESGTVDLTELEEVQHLDPSYVSETMAQMQALLDEMLEISGLTGEDAAVAYLLSNSSATRDAADARYERHVPAATAFPAINRALIQSAIDTVVANGGGRVTLFPGATYIVDVIVHPEESTIATAIMLDSNVHLDLNGATIQLEDDTTDPGTTGDLDDTEQGKLTIVSVARPYSNLVASHHDIRVSDGTIDGRASEQTIQAFGLWFNRVRSGWVDRVKIKNVRGVGSAPPGETFFFEALNCTDIHFTSCEAVCDDGSDTATGFVANISTGITWTDCVAHGMTHGMGFAHWRCAEVVHTACRAYDNYGAGFNTEISESVTYIGCDAGFRSADVGSAQPGPFWDSVQEHAGNGFGGFLIQGSKIVDLIGCRARYNTASGLTIKNNTIGPTYSDTIRVIGGQYGPGNGRGIEIQASETTNVSISGNVDTSGNTAVNVIPVGCADTATAAIGGAPFHYYRNLNGSSGMRFNLVGPDGSSAPSSFGYRWYIGGALAMEVNLGGDILPTRAIRLKGYTTAGRPNASLGAGGGVYDTTLQKPIWSDGTNWREGSLVFTGSATLDFPSVAAGSYQELTLTVTGAIVGDTVCVGPPVTVAALGIGWNAWVSAGNTVTIRVFNVTGSAIDPASGTWKVTCVR